MGIVIGIDVGGSTTKIVGIDNGRIQSPMFITATDPVTSLFGAFGKYIYDNGIKLSDVEQVMLTGVGSAFIDSPLYGLPTDKIDEFIANGLGARHATDIDHLIVVSMGTGTSFVRIDCDKVEHIGGIGIGGGTLQGLSRLLLKTNDIHQVAELAMKGDIKHINLLIGDICNRALPDLPVHEFDTKKADVIYEDRSLVVSSIPLKHRMPCCGFLFAEKQLPNHIKRDMVDFYKVPVFELNRIKNGADYITPEGETIPNSILTTPSESPRKYAYCSDTIYHPAIVEQVKGVDLLFHESTFLTGEIGRAKETFHSTAAQAAHIARMAEVKRLLIGHFSARYEDDSVFYDEAAAIFPDTILAKEMLCIPV